MSERIYSQGEGDNLEPLEESSFEDEDALQALIAKYPELLDGEQMRPGDPLRWILITREQGIPDRPDAGNRWSVDHLILDQDARPTLVEVKRGDNTQIRREVVGQMLEYAAHAQQTWTIDELRQTFEVSAEQRGSTADEELARLLGEDTEPDADEFWDKVATNLAASRLRLLFVSDNIPDELERIVTFLNAQMPSIEVLAVEIKRFKGQSSQTLVPRVLGRALTAPKTSSGSPRRKLTRESFLDKYSAPHHREVVVRLMGTAEAQGGNISFGSSGISIRVACKPWTYDYVSVAWLFPPGVTGWGGLIDITFGESITLYESPPDGALKEVIDHWAGACIGVPDGKAPPPKWARGKTFDYDAAAQNIDQLEQMLAEIIPALANLPVAN